MSLDWLPWLWLIIPGIPVAVVVIFTPMLIIAALVEKRRALPYRAVEEPGHGRVQIGPYLEEMIEETKRLVSQ